MFMTKKNLSGLSAYIHCLFLYTTISNVLHGFSNLKKKTHYIAPNLRVRNSHIHNDFMKVYKIELKLWLFEQSYGFSNLKKPINIKKGNTKKKRKKNLSSNENSVAADHNFFYQPSFATCGLQGSCLIYESNGEKNLLVGQDRHQ